MNKILLIILLTSFASVNAQNILPYSGNGICLDTLVPVSSTPLPAARNMIVKDFDEDGNQDVLVANASLNAIVIYKNNGNGTFSLNVVTGSVSFTKFNSVTAGFFNNDSRPDIAISSSDSISIFENLGGMNFSLVSVLSVPGYSNNPTLLKTADLNNDLLDDLILAAPKIPSFGGLGMIMIRNNFVPPASYNFTFDYSKQIFTYSPPLTSVLGGTVNMDFTIGDFDGDNNNDIVTTYTEKKDSVWFFKNISVAGNTLNFVPIAVRSPTLLQSYSVTLRNCEMKDIDKDGFSDLVLITSAFNGTVTIMGYAMITGGNIISTAPALYQSVLTDFNGSNIPLDFELADINGDNFKDFVGIRDNRMWIYFWDSVPDINYPKGHFLDGSAVILDMPTGSSIDEITSGDFDNNNKTDIFYKPWRFGSGKINVIPNFSYPVEIAASTTAICSGASAILTAGSNTTGIEPTYTWFKSPGSNALGSGASFGVNQPGTYWTHLTFPFPYGGGSCTSFKSDTLQILPMANPTISVSGTSVVCAGSSASLTASGSGTNSFSYLWIGPGNDTLSTSPFTTTNPVIIQETYSVFATELISSCSGSATASVGIYPPDNNNISASKTLICQGDSAMLSLNGATSYTWSTASFDSVIYVKPSSGTDYVLLYRDSNGCLSSKSIRIDIDLTCDIKIYNTITKNGDSFNDIWTIDNIGRFPDNRVTIFNRWGKKVFETRGYDNVNNFWPARNNNESLDPSTYYYVIELGNGSKPLKGWIELIKN